MASRKPKLAAQAPGIVRRRTLKVLGTFISLLEAVRVRASADLGFDLAFEALDFPSCQRKAALDPEAYHRWRNERLSVTPRCAQTFAYEKVIGDRI
jgi:hypothetical protein